VQSQTCWVAASTGCEASAFTIWSPWRTHSRCGRNCALKIAALESLQRSVAVFELRQIGGLALG